MANLKKGTDAAHAKAAEATRLLALAQSTQALQSGAAQQAAHLALAQRQAATAAQEATQNLHLQQQEELKRQLAETQAKLNAQVAELAKQQAAMRPSASSITPAAVLPVPSMPEGVDAANAMYSLRASLLLLAEQDTPALVSWGDLAAGHLHWPDICRLVPHHLIEESVAGIDPTAGPAADAHVPRRVLELLRKQLDEIVAEWMRDNAAKVAVAEEKHALSAWAQTVLDQAKRLQECKRPAASSDAQQPAPRRLRSPSPAPTPEPPMQVDSVAVTQVDTPDDVPATQLDGTPAIVIDPAAAAA